jgi:hypothetical protein
MPETHQRLIAVSGTIGLLHKSGVPLAAAKLIIGPGPQQCCTKSLFPIKRMQPTNTMGNCIKTGLFFRPSAAEMADFPLPNRVRHVAVGGIRH